MNAVPELRLLLEQHPKLEQPPVSRAAIGTVLVHIVLAALIAIMPAPPPPSRAGQVVADLSRATPLVLPPRELTQPDPNRGKVSQEVDLKGLLSRRSPLPQPPSRPSPTLPAAPRTIEAPAAAAAAPRPVIQPPKIDVQSDQTELAKNLPAIGTPATPPPPPEIQATEKPKIAFESPGAISGSPKGSGAAGPRLLETPRTSVQELARDMSRTGAGGGLSVGDVVGSGAGGLGEALSGSPGLRNASNVELLSDPLGADFRPYLIQILAMVRRNWVAVLPESARLGRRGKTQIQFAIARDGSVPKLVIATPSGTEALDRAAVAGISASNPFPPLPNDFKGGQVRLQFTFLYNIPR
jgi:TonB family protein